MNNFLLEIIFHKGIDKVIITNHQIFKFPIFAGLIIFLGISNVYA